MTPKTGRRRGLIYGVGVNDAPYVTSKCPYYQKWRSMLQRVLCPKFQAEYPNYVGCTVEPSWLSFMAFRTWMENQDWQGKDLDKDLLSQGNKHYGPDTCLFIDQALNKLLCLRGNKRGQLPLGVTYTTIRSKKYISAYCSFYGKTKNLGYFDSVDEAAAAYKAAKLKHIAELAANETNPQIKAALLRLY